MLKKGDIILVLILLFVVAAGFAGQKIYKSLNKGEHRIAVIKQGDKVIKKIDLETVAEPQKIEIGGEYLDIILVEKGRISFYEADCPDLVCVKSGWLTEKGDMAVCLPNRVSIKIEGEKDSVDGVAY